MKSPNIWKSFAALAAVAAFGMEAAALEPGKSRNGELRLVNGAYVLRVWGSPRQRGIAHGMLVAGDFITAVNSAFKARVLTKERFEERILPLVRSAFSWPLHIKEEIAGILEGIDIALPEEERKIAALGRCLNLDDMLAVNSLGDWMAFACSTVSVFGSAARDGHTIVGRNFDYLLPPKMAECQIILAEEAGEGRLAFHTTAFAGTVGGITCLNEKGVFAAVHDVHVVPRETPKGCTPRLAVLRLIAEKAGSEKPVETALLICRENASAYGNVFHIAAASGAQPPLAGIIEYDSDEATDAGATLRTPADGMYAINTNHYRKRSRPSDCPRFRALEETMSVLTGQSLKIDMGVMKTVIAEAEVKFTMHQMVADLDERTVCVAFQKRPMVPASSSGFSMLAWKDVFPEAAGKN